MTLRRFRPSPAMAVALMALVVAVGGVAFATIPDSSGTFHGCVVKASGKLRVVESAGDCRSNERAIAWNEQGPPGPPGGAVVARMRSAPVDLPSSPPLEVPLSGNTWVQGPDEFQIVHAQLEVSDFGCAVRVNVVVDDEVLVAFDLFQVFGLEKKIFLDLPLFEPGSRQTHELAIQVRRDGSCPRLESVKVDVLGFR